MTSTNVPEPLTDQSIDAIRGALVELQADRDETETFFHDLLGTLGSMRVDLAENEHKLRGEQEQLIERESRIEHSLSRIKQREKSMMAEKAQFKTASATLDEMRQSVASMQGERDEALRKLEEAASELTSVEEVVRVLETTQADLDDTRRQLKDTKTRLTEQASDVDEEGLAKIRAKNLQLQADLHRSKRECHLLAEHVEEKNLELKLHKERWSGELGNIRDRLKQRAESLKTQGSNTADFDRAIASQGLEPDEATEGRSTRPAASGSSPTKKPSTNKAPVEIGPQQQPTTTDPVVGSVLAQLAKLGKSIDNIEK